jgi:mRNA-degrading endonuclease RelE of RelBE toxin-antitoxin system
VAAIRALGEDPRPPAAVKLTAFDPPAWRIRISQYRAVYEIDGDQVVVIAVNVAPRGEVYH